MAEKIVAASGYFDPFHVGHLEYLQKAKKLGAKLIVIVNNDRQTINKKGYVFMNAEDRMRIIQALECVDEAVLSIDEDSTVCKTLARIKPAIFAKGGDRYSHEIPEAPVCREHGIIIVDGLGKKIRASSELITRERENKRLLKKLKEKTENKQAEELMKNQVIKEKNKFYIMDEKRDLEIYEKIKLLENEKLDKKDKELAGLIKTQLEKDRRKYLLLSLNKLIRKYGK